jgi:transposase InsO family protein/transposase-like protein
MSQRKIRKWSIAEKLEAIQARQQGLTLEDLRGMFGVKFSSHTLGKWMRAYEESGIAGLERTWPQHRNLPCERSPKVEAAGKILEEVMPREGGVGKAQGALYRKGFLKLARETVRRLLRGGGHGPQAPGVRRRNKPPQPKFFERAHANELWQTDIMSFMLKGQYRVYLIGFMDDHSRFLVGWGLYRFQTAANVQEVFRASIEKHGLPKEVLSDNGRQYYTWRGKSQFTTTLTKLGIRHIRSRPYHPQTLGKIESFWRNLLQECLSRVPLATFEEAKDKIGEYIEYYNFKRPHQGIGNLMPSDRFYGVADQVKQIVESNTAKLEEATVPAPAYTPPTYIVGNIGGRELRVVAKEAEVTLKELEKVESAAGGNHGASETSQSAGAAGPDSFGVGEAGVRGESVSAGGGVEGTVLPVDESGAGGGAQSVGSEGTRPQTHTGREVAGAGAEVGPAGSASGDGTADLAQGTGSLETFGGGGGSDHPSAKLGFPAPGGI